MCVTLNSVTVSARYCPSAAANLLALPRTPVPAAAQLNVSAQCVTNASPTASGAAALPRGVCDGIAGGLWQSGAIAVLAAGFCACNSGYAPSADQTACYRMHTFAQSLLLCVLVSLILSAQFDIFVMFDRSDHIFSIWTI